MADMLFPPYLNQGSKGPAVAALQLILKAILDFENEIVVDGEYGYVTARSVRRLQDELGVEQDGNFGPQTRAMLLDDYQIDVNVIPANIFVGETTAVTPETA